MSSRRVIVVGGGAAGFFAAITCAEAAPDCEVTLLEKVDHEGVSMRRALTDFGLDPAQISRAAHKRDDVLAYAELHIEQGPVLEAEGLAVGVVTAINGANRLLIEIDGMALVDLTDIGMLFVRCKGGISHNPAEAITLEDAGTGARVFLRFIENFRPAKGS